MIKKEVNEKLLETAMSAVIKAKNYFWQPLKKSIRKNCQLIKDTPVVKASLGNKAGILGGAFLVFNYLNKT